MTDYSPIIPRVSPGPLVPEKAYMVLEVRVSYWELARLPLTHSPRAYEASLRGYLATKGLRPDHPHGTIETWDDPDACSVHYRQYMPREEQLNQ